MLTALSLPERFALILGGMCRVTAERAARNHASIPVLMLLWHRLRRVLKRFAALAARAAAGPLPPPRRRAVPPTPRPPRPRPPDRIPEPYAWLLRLVPETAAYGSQFQYLLADPEMQALLAAAPQAGRLLRPLCRALAIPVPDFLRRPPPPLTPGRQAPPDQAPAVQAPACGPPDQGPPPAAAPVHGHPPWPAIGPPGRR